MPARLEFLRTTMPNPARRVSYPPGRTYFNVYYHPVSRRLIGAELIRGNTIAVLTDAESSQCRTEVCHCFECLSTQKET